MMKLKRRGAKFSEVWTVISIKKIWMFVFGLRTTSEFLQSFVEGRTVRNFWKLRTTYGSLIQPTYISQKGTKVCALAIACFGQLAKNYMVKTESLVGGLQTVISEKRFRKMADHYIFLIRRILKSIFLMQISKVCK